MPWHIARNAGGCSGYAVIQDTNNEVVGCHPTKQDAEKQLAALYASETSKSVPWGNVFLPETD